MILNCCSYKGVFNFKMNPKAVSLNQLMGVFDETSREWTDGVMTIAFRQA